MGITKTGPNKYIIKARVIITNKDPRKKRSDKRKVETFFGNERQANDRYLALKSELRAEKSKPQFQSHFRFYLEQYRDLRGGTIPQKQRAVYDSLDSDVGNVDITDLRDFLFKYSKIIQRIPSKMTGKLLSNGSINRRRAMALAALNLAKDLNQISDVPLTKSVWPKLSEIPRDRRLHDHEIVNLINTINEHAPHIYYLFWFAINVPCRKSELVNMTIDDLNLFANAIRIPNGTTKNEEGTWKPIPRDMLNYFRTLPEGTKYLFYRMVGGRCRRIGDFKKSWSKCKKIAGIANFRFHDTRHIAARNMIIAGMAERDVMKIAGWKTNMLSTYWGSSSLDSLSRVKFISWDAIVGGNSVSGGEGNSQDKVVSGVKKAVS